MAPGVARTFRRHSLWANICLFFYLQRARKQVALEVGAETVTGQLLAVTADAIVDLKDWSCGTAASHNTAPFLSSMYVFYWAMTF